MYAFQRVGTPMFKPWIAQVSHRISRDARFFMIGSCFARGLEKALSGHGFSVLSLSEKFDAFAATEGTTPLGATNRYNTASILNEIQWALDPGTAFPREAILDLKDGTAIDPHMNPNLVLVDRESTQERRRIFSEVVAHVAEADVLILTLGLVEAWVDRQLGLAMNMAPTLPMVRQYPDRFAFCRLNYADNLRNLEEIRQLMSRHGKPGHRIIVTVSPVPLGATFTNEDIVQANAYSKSTLRAVATDFSAAHENVDYFPSYEIVMNSRFETAWIEDKRHPRGELAQHIMRTFVQHYVEGVDMDQVELAEKYVA